MTRNSTSLWQDDQPYITKWQTQKEFPDEVWIWILALFFTMWRRIRVWNVTTREWNLTPSIPLLGVTPFWPSEIWAHKATPFHYNKYCWEKLWFGGPHFWISFPFLSFHGPFLKPFLVQRIEKTKLILWKKKRIFFWNFFINKIHNNWFFPFQKENSLVNSLVWFKFHPSLGWPVQSSTYHPIEWILKGSSCTSSLT